MTKSVDAMIEKDRAAERGEVQQKSPTKLQVALEALEAYIVADSWVEAKHVVEMYRDVLLTDMIDDVLMMVIAQYEDAETLRVLMQYRKVLLRCRVAGVDAAFAELLTERATCPPGVDLTLWRRVLLADSSSEVIDLLAEHPELIPHITRRLTRTLDHRQRALLYALEAFLGAESWHAVWECVEMYPVLLSLDADIWLSQYAIVLIRQGEDDAAEIVTARRWLLAECRAVGVEAVFSGRMRVWDGMRVDVEPVLNWTMSEPAQAV